MIGILFSERAVHEQRFVFVIGIARQNVVQIVCERVRFERGERVLSERERVALSYDKGQRTLRELG